MSDNKNYKSCMTKKRIRQMSIKKVLKEENYKTKEIIDFFLGMVSKSARNSMELS